MLHSTSHIYKLIKQETVIIFRQYLLCYIRIDAVKQITEVNNVTTAACNSGFTDLACLTEICKTAHLTTLITKFKIKSLFSFFMKCNSKQLKIKSFKESLCIIKTKLF